MEQKIQEFLALMYNLQQYEVSTGESGDFGDPNDQCETCKNAVCKMIQKNNPPLLCHTKYNGSTK
jgi:hypothetical protein